MANLKRQAHGEDIKPAQKKAKKAKSPSSEATASKSDDDRVCEKWQPSRDMIWRRWAYQFKPCQVPMVITVVPTATLCVLAGQYLDVIILEFFNISV